MEARNEAMIFDGVLMGAFMGIFIGGIGGVFTLIEWLCKFYQTNPHSHAGIFVSNTILSTLVH